MSIGVRLKEIRLAHQLTQAQLAQKIFVSRQAISGWENGKSQPDLENLIMLSELYQVTLDELLKGEQVEMTANHLETTQKYAPTHKYMLILFFWSLFTVIMQIIFKTQRFEMLTLYAFGGLGITAWSLWRSNRLSNLYSQGEDMYDMGIFLCCGFAVLIIASIGFNGL